MPHANAPVELVNITDVDQDMTHLMEFPSGGIASVSGNIFCLLVDADGTLSSTGGFLFFASAAWACSSRKLRVAALDGIAANSCALGLQSLAGVGDRNDSAGEVCPSTGVTHAVAGGWPSLITSRGRGNGGAEVSHADADSVSARGAVSVRGWRMCNDLLPSVLPGDAPVRGVEEVSSLLDAALVSIRMWSTRGVIGVSR